MNQEDKRNPKNWTKEETGRVVAVFQWLWEQDKKQNPDRYKNLLLKDRRNYRINLLKMSLQGLTDHGSGSRTPAIVTNIVKFKDKKSKFFTIDKGGVF